MTVVFGGVGGLQSDGHTLKVALPPNVDGTKNRAILRTLEERLGKVIALKVCDGSKGDQPECEGGTGLGTRGVDNLT